MTITERVRSTCTECDGSDTHPKHHVDDCVHHLDCGRARGCIMCDSILRASGELHGEALTRFMQSRVEVPVGT